MAARKSMRAAAAGGVDFGWKPALGCQTGWADALAHVTYEYNGGAPFWRRLIGNWMMNEGAGSKIADQALYGNGVVVVRVPANNDNSQNTGVTWIGCGIHGTSMNFNPNLVQAAYVQVPYNSRYPIVQGSQIGQRSFTVECWFWLNVQGNYNGLVSKQSSSSVYPKPFDMYVDIGGTLSAFLGDGGSSYTSLTTSVAAKTWYHVILVCDDTLNNRYGYLYLNGAQKAKVALVANIADDASADLFFGTRRDFATTLNGRLSYVRLWQGALDAVAVSRLYRAQLGAITAPPQQAIAPGGPSDPSVIGIFPVGVINNPLLF